MNTEFVVVILVLSLVAWVCRPRYLRVDGSQIRVIDGDTFDLIGKAGQKLRIRCDGYDSPEIDQPGGKLVRKKMVELARQGLTLQLGAADYYGRITAMVWTKEGRLDRVMIAAGLAHHDSRSPLIRFLFTTGPRLQAKGIWKGSAFGLRTMHPKSWRRIKAHRRDGHF